ncbi:phage integrase [Teredinibacter turnerae]|uniref:phage integrase n=1 Tax=Teredinibacter turnerae TaxID=2426 RepID=UPI0005F853CB|nr:tyrosine-type recombinase/integrase [Teredinibacter turnerae]
MPIKTDQGWRVDIRPAGRNGPRFRKTFQTRDRAIAYERHQRQLYGKTEDWEKEKADRADRRHLSDLVSTWWKLHGQQLKSGGKRKTELDKVVELLNDPLAKDFDAQAFSNLRARRLKTVTANTVNHDLANFRSLFNELKRLGEWQGENPVAGIRRIKIAERELSYLDKKQIKTLLTELDKYKGSHAGLIARLCLSTGARWGEVCNLKASQVRGNKLHLTDTKSGKNRSIPISPELATQVKENAPLVDGMNTFKRAVEKLKFTLPRGQKTHILRHTFASWFMINGGNIITLQRILGHGSLAMTIRYAHLSPDHLNEALELNPIAGIQ